MPATTPAPVPAVDLCLGSSERDASARVLVTVTDADHAEAILAAIRDAQAAGALYQTDGLVPFARDVER